MRQSKKKTAPEQRIGTTVGVHASGKVYAENVVFTAAQGHGFAAEQANHLHDRLSLRHAVHEGTNLKLNGADRVVDGVQIQTKYCESGSKSIAQCFDAQSRFAYWADDGRPMQIEVAPDQYEDAVQAMRTRIAKGQVVLVEDGKVAKAVVDPDEAVNIVRRGHYDYATARAIARAGTIEGLTFDTVKGIEVAGSAAGISAAISYALAIWRGEDHAVALETACLAGIKVGGVAWLTSVATAQIGRTGLSQTLVPVSQAIVNRMGANVARQVAALAGKNLSGAAAKSFVAKLGRGNAIAATVTTLVMSSADLFRMFEGRASFAQVFKTVAVNGASAAGGIGGAAAGAAQGAAWGSAIPGPGTIIGGLIGGLIGAFAGSSVAESTTRFVLDGLIEDDAVEMLSILQAMFAEQAQVYLLTQSEADQVLGKLEAADLPSALRDMYGASDRQRHARSILTPMMDAVAAARSPVALPGADELARAAERLLESAAAADGQAPTRVYNETGSLSLEMPADWTMQTEATNPESFAMFQLPSKRVSVAVTVVDAESTATAEHHAQAMLKGLLKNEPQRAFHAVESASVGERHASRFSVVMQTASGAQYWTTFYVMRLARYFVHLQVVSKAETIDAGDLEAVSDWFASLQLHAVDCTAQESAATIVDAYSGIQMVVPPGWKGDVLDDAGDPAQTQIFALHTAFAEVQVYAFGNDSATAYQDYLAAFVQRFTDADAQARTSVREDLVNGRPAAHGHVVASVDGASVQIVLTTLQFDGFVVMLTSALGGLNAWEYYEQCEALAWSVGLVADDSADDEDSDLALAAA